MQPITPYLTVNGADKALEFYQQAFGATDIFSHPDKDGRLFHARMVINGGTVMMSDDYSKDHGGPPAPTPDNPAPVAVSILLQTHAARTGKCVGPRVEDEVRTTEGPVIALALVP